MRSPLQPVLVMPVYRGGEKFVRALASIRDVETYFRRIIVSLNGPLDSADQHTMAEYQALSPSKVEVIATGEELPWIPHQFFWLSYLERTGEGSDDWVMWFAHDDELRPRGIRSFARPDKSWPLHHGTTYLGPWGVRYDPPGGLFDGSRQGPLESWTSFPTEGPLRASAPEWISNQLRQPTYINMSGCVTRLASFQQLCRFPFTKPGGMRIEMATAAAPVNRFVEEFPEPLVITYTSVGSDRTTYAAVARRDDAHLMAWLINYLLHHPTGTLPLLRTATAVSIQRVKQAVTKSPSIGEDWRRRENVEP